MTMKTNIGVLVTAVLWTASAPVQADERGMAHPERWPQAHSRGLVDAKTEDFVSALLAKMTLEEKVGQMIQADTSAVKPDDLREFEARHRQVVS